MSFKWTEFLTLAEALQSDPNSPGPAEAALRSAASRAYYAALHCAQDFALGSGFVPKYSAEDHKRVLVHFQRDYHPSNPAHKKVAHQVAKELDRLRGHRREADYDKTLTRQPNSLAGQAIGMAKSILENLDILQIDGIS